jgi:uncharacterized repeat protein (TIGR03803 family)
MVFRNRIFRGFFPIAAMAAALGASFFAAPARAQDTSTPIIEPTNEAEFPNRFERTYDDKKGKYRYFYTTYGSGNSTTTNCGAVWEAIFNEKGRYERSVLLHQFTSTDRNGCHPNDLSVSYEPQYGPYVNVYTSIGGPKGTGGILQIVVDVESSSGQSNGAGVSSVGGSVEPASTKGGALPGSSSPITTIYVTSYTGGASNNGAVFASTVSSTGTLGAQKLIFSFPGGKRGAAPGGPAVVGPDGNLYGTTQQGGDKTTCSNGCGIIYRLVPPATSGAKWTEQILYAFKGGADFLAPVGRLAFDADGNVYGVAPLGGTCTGGAAPGGGVFMLTKQATTPWPFTPLYVFCQQDGSSPDGLLPSYGVTLDADGNVYGVASGGANDDGVVFELVKPATPTSGFWEEVVLHTFAGGTKDGADPSGALSIVGDDIFGTTYAGGKPGNPPCKNQAPEFPVLPGCGVVFELTPK